MQVYLLSRCALFVSAIGLTSSACLAGLGDCTTDADCQDGNPCTADQCDNGACVHTNEPDNTLCPDELFCNGRERCEGGVCTDRADACVDLDHCDEEQNVCLACISDDECTDPDECTEGQCILNICTFFPKPAGTPCGDPSDTDCDDPDTCDGSGTCQSNTEPSDTVCRPAADECDVEERCNGVDSDCPANEFALLGTACGDGSDTVCDNPDTCDGAGACLDNLEPATTVCREAADDCDVGERCTGTDAECPADALAAAGTPCGDPTDTLCDGADTCDGSGGCQANVTADGTACPDDIFCNGEETCVSGLCSPGDDPCVDRDHCDETANACLECVSDGECDDGSDCTDDACVDNVCVHTPAPGCEIQAVLDIRPGSCPNPISRRSKGVIPAAILGSDLLDVTQIDPESLELRRSDGLGGFVQPLMDRRGLGMSIHNVPGPAGGEGCDCWTLGSDGIADLVMTFSTSDVVSEFDLTGEAPGSTVELTITGSLLDGTEFSATDCVRVQPNGRQ